MLRTLIFSDLDGTLLDHDDYSFEAARASLCWLSERHIDVILNTSKTAAETKRLHRKMLLQAPFVVENGAAAYQSNGELLAEWGMPRAQILRLLHGLRVTLDCQFLGFSDVSVEQICQWTGLDQSAARDAQDRKWSEPLRWNDTEEKRLLMQESLREHGLSMLRGGRFWHVQGAHDKGLALQHLTRGQTQAHLAIALGDGDNDVAMLKAADIAVCVRSAYHDYPRVGKHQHVIYTQAYGPEGWAEAITQLAVEGQIQA